MEGLVFIRNKDSWIVLTGEKTEHVDKEADRLVILVVGPESR